MLRAIYFDQLNVNEEDAPAESLRFASRMIGSMGATVEPMQFGHDSEEDQDEDIVYSRDPLATGLMMDSSASGKGVELSDIPIAGSSKAKAWGGV